MTELHRGISDAIFNIYSLHLYTSFSAVSTTPPGSPKPLVVNLWAFTQEVSLSSSFLKKKKNQMIYFVKLYFHWIKE